MSTEALEIGVITDTHSAFQGSLNGDIVFGLGDYCGKGEANKIIGNYDKYLLITGNHDDFSYPITNLSKDEYTILKLPETAELRKTPESCVITSIYDNIYLMLTHEPPTKKQIFYVIESLDIKNSNLISLSGHTHKKTSIEKFNYKNNNALKINLDSYADVYPWNNKINIKGFKYNMKIDETGHIEFTSTDKNNKQKTLINEKVGDKYFNYY